MEKKRDNAIAVRLNRFLKSQFKGFCTICPCNPRPRCAVQTHSYGDLYLLSLGSAGLSVSSSHCVFLPFFPMACLYYFCLDEES